jgi:hypothetical protein
MIRILQKSKTKSRVPFICPTGYCTGLCIMSKVQGVFLWFGFGGYILFSSKCIAEVSLFWLSAVICLAFMFPIYWWNFENHFITYHYHGGRIDFLGKA